MSKKKKSKTEIPINELDGASNDSHAEAVPDNSESDTDVKPGDFSSLDNKPDDVEVNGDTAAEEIDDVARLTELWQRERANFINYRRRVDEEKAEIRKYAIYDMACGLITVLDYFESSVSYSKNLPDDARNVILGVEYTIEELKRVLSTHGVTPIQVEDGDRFNTNLMEAVQRRENAEAESGTILEVLRRGWTLHDRVIRAAQVVVAVSPDENSDEGGDETGSADTA